MLGPIPKCFVDIQDKLVPLFALKSNIYQVYWTQYTASITDVIGILIHFTCIHYVL